MNAIITDPQKIEEVLSRGTIVEVLPSLDEFKKVLQSGKKLKFYIGFDATAPTLHLSHAKNFILLEKFRKLGHEAIVLFGDFTARIGDPTGESSARKQLTREDVLENVRRWKELIRPLMNFDDPNNPPVVKYNHDWLSKLTFEDVIGLASHLTVQQMLERDMFQKRLSENKPIHLHEFFYPLMQGYDSVAMDVDVELCGTDQIFNALVGRTLQRKINNKDKFVVAVTLMADPKTGELMSKSKGTGVFLHVSAKEMYGQVMSQTDEMLELLFVNNTFLSLAEIKEIMSVQNPRDAKMKLALEICRIFYGEAAAQEAEHNFVEVFQKKLNPEVIREVRVSESPMHIFDLLVTAGLTISKSEARRVVTQKGVKIDGQVIDTEQEITIPAEGILVQKGKREFVRVLPG